jgi:hypothetical protein
MKYRVAPPTAASGGFILIEVVKVVQAQAGPEVRTHGSFLVRVQPHSLRLTVGNRLALS